jgi:oxygen-dependent protoporphyrinogen oxidase
MAIACTARTLGVGIQPADAWIFRHPLGISQYTLGHRQRVADVEQVCRDMGGLAFVGASYRGASLNRCIRDAYTVAPRALAPWGLEVPADGNGESARVAGTSPTS